MRLSQRIWLWACRLTGRPHVVRRINHSFVAAFPRAQAFTRSQDTIACSKRSTIWRSGANVRCVFIHTYCPFVEDSLCGKMLLPRIGKTHELTTAPQCKEDEMLHHILYRASALDVTSQSRRHVAAEANSTHRAEPALLQRITNTRSAVILSSMDTDADSVPVDVQHASTSDQGPCRKKHKKGTDPQWQAITSAMKRKDAHAAWRSYREVKGDKILQPGMLKAMAMLFLGWLPMTSI